MAVRLLIADDHHIVTDGLQLLLDKKTNDVEIIAVAENGKEVLDILDKEKVDVFLIDIEMPEMNGIELAEKLMEINPESRIIMFSTHSNRKMIENALELGVKGYLLKEDTSRNLVNAIREVSEGNTFYSQKIANFVFNSYLNAKRGPKKNKNDLTPREMEVLKLIADGYSKQEIGKKLDISANTVNIHRKNIMGKLDIHNAIELTKYAIREGVITLQKQELGKAIENGKWRMENGELLKAVKRKA